MKRFKCTLIDTTYDYSVEQVNDFLYCNDEEAELATEKYDDVYNKVVEEFRQQEIEDFWENLKYDKKYGKDSYSPCIIIGSCGCWNGRHEIVPVKCKNLYEAISKCADDMLDIVVKQNCSKIEFTGLHHDGRNHFEIHFLNDWGDEVFDRWYNGYSEADLTNRRYHKTIKDYIW